MSTLVNTKIYRYILPKDSNGICKSRSLYLAIPIKLQIIYEEKVIVLFVLPFSKLVSCIYFSKVMTLGIKPITKTKGDRVFERLKDSSLNIYFSELFIAWH